MCEGVNGGIWLALLESRQRCYDLMLLGEATVGKSYKYIPTVVIYLGKKQERVR